MVVPNVIKTIKSGAAEQREDTIFLRELRANARAAEIKRFGFNELWSSG